MSSTETLLFEIGTEELPASYLEPALQFLENSLADALDEARLGHGEVRAEGTPRRLTVTARDVDGRQPDASDEVTGPKVSIAYTEDGELSKAGLGFLRGRGVDPKDAFKKSTDKGEVIACKVFEEGRPAAEVVPEILAGLVGRVPFKKTMRWTDEKTSFARPVRWLLALYGEAVLDVTYGDVASANTTRGHRYHAPEPIVVKSPAAYADALKTGHVVLSRVERREIIKARATDLAASIGGRLIDDEDLIEEVANLVEQPWPVLGRFEERFLEMPRELLVSEMREHQRYFAVEQADGSSLMNAFVVVAGSEPKDPEFLAAGNTRVLRSRFEDGAFYFEEDKKLSLEARHDELGRMTFQRELGTVLERVERVTGLTEDLAQLASTSDDDKRTAARAAALSKSDLVTGVVGEFPELQGIMGRDYALVHGETAAVATAIEEHYWPLGASGDIAASVPGALVALADRADLIVGILGVGKVPSGSADPFALRRAAIGLCRTILGQKFDIHLHHLVEKTSSRLGDKIGEVREQALEFIGGRLRGVLEGELEGTPRDVIDAAMGAGFYDVVDCAARARALGALRAEDPDDFTALAGTFKRVGNILKKARADGLEVDADRDAVVKEAAEIALKEAATGLAKVDTLDGRIAALIAIRPKVDTFFDEVLVMSEVEEEKLARLSLLARIEGILTGLADFTRVQTID